MQVGDEKVAVTGYAVRFGPSDWNLRDARERLVDKVNEYGGLKVFHVIEVPPREYHTRGDAWVGTIWVVDDTTLQELDNYDIQVLDTKGVSPDEAADVVITLTAEQKAELNQGRGVLARVNSNLAPPPAHVSTAVRISDAPPPLQVARRVRYDQPPPPHMPTSVRVIDVPPHGTVPGTPRLDGDPHRLHQLSDAQGERMMTPRFVPFELSTLRAGDLVVTDAVELPWLVFVWDEKKGRWVGNSTATHTRLQYPAWKRIYDIFDPEDYDAVSTDDLGVTRQLKALCEGYLMLRIRIERPNASDHQEDDYVALHELDLIRVQRTVPEPVPAPTHPSPDLHLREGVNPS